MRKWNLVLVAGMLVTFLIHGIMGALQLAGAAADARQTVGWICVGFLCAHVAVTLALTVQTLRAGRRAGAGYFRGNELFWLRRISGFAILPPLAAHLLIFRASAAAAYRLQVFTTGRLISQLLLVIAIALHVLTNIRPVLIALGIRDRRALAVDLLLVLAVLLLLFGAAFVLYYLRWAAY